MEIIAVGMLIFVFSVALLVLGQRVRRAPMPVGCTPTDGVCCREGVGTACRNAGENMQKTAGKA